MVGRLTRCWFPARVRTTVQGWVGVFAGRFGGLSANVLVLTVMIGICGFSWRAALYVLAAAGIVHGIIFLVAFRDSPRQHPNSNEAEAELVEGEEGAAANEPLKFRELIGQMDRRSFLNLACINVASIFSSIADQIYSLWIPLFLVEQYSLKYKEMGIYSALPLLGGACGGMLGGFISDRLIRLTGSRRWVRSLVGFFGKAMAAATLAIAVSPGVRKRKSATPVGAGKAKPWADIPTWTLELSTSRSLGAARRSKYRFSNRTLPASIAEKPRTSKAL